MTPFKNFSRGGEFPRRIRRGGLYVAVAAMIATHTQCTNSDSGASGEWEEVTTYEVTKGVITTLEETGPDQFEVVDEQVVSGKDSSRVIIRRLNGETDTLMLNDARGLVSAQDTVYRNTNSGYHRPGHGLGTILWWSSMGYMMGRSFNSPSYPGIYRSGSSTAGFYRSPAAQELQRTAVSRTQMRPVSGKSGFFRNSGRSTGIS